MTVESQSREFTVVLGKSGREYVIPADRSILEVLLDAGEDILHSCRVGVCGTCETRIVSGRPDHRDLILSDEEHALGNTLLICCSRSLDDRLVLDL